MSPRDTNVIRRKHPKRVAIVIANPAKSTTTGRPVDVRWSERTHPYVAIHVRSLGRCV